MGGGLCGPPRADENAAVRTLVAIAALGSCLAGAASLAASPPAVPQSLLACSKLSDSAARLRCYDAQIGTLQHASAASAGQPAAPESGSSVPGTPAARAAVAAPAAPARASGAQAAAAEQARAAAQFGADSLPPAERPPSAPKPRLILHSTIREKVQAGPDVYLITLANGQVWRMNDSPVLYFFHAGDAIRIERQTFGDYHLWSAATGAKNWVLVRRVR